MSKLLRLIVMLLVITVAGCKQEADPGITAPTAETPTTATANTAAVPLADELTVNDRAVVGVTYPPGINQYPGLAQAVRTYVDAARAEMEQSLSGLGNDKPRFPYELSLKMEQPINTPQLAVISATGSRYTGGAHGEPLTARFVWLPEQNKLLTSTALVAKAEGWLAISAYVREQLRTAASVQAEARDDGDAEVGTEQTLPDADHLDEMKRAYEMIDAGTEPDPANFDLFEPVLDANNKVTGLKFVFPPYQVGAYADGEHTVVVPVSVLRPYLAPELTGLFAKE